MTKLLNPGEASATRSVERATTLLWLVVAHPEGARLIDLAASAGLHKATALRLLSALERQGLIERDPESKLYSLGLELLMASWASPRSTRLRDLGAAALRRVAQATGDTVFLSVRSGLDSLCLDRAEGDFPIKTLTLEIGSRRPLGVGAGSLALLAFLPEEEAQRVLRDGAQHLAPYRGYTVALLTRLIEETRARGFAFNPGMIVPGMQAVAVPVMGGPGHPLAALSVAAINERMTPDRVEAAVTLLRTEARGMAEALSQKSPRRKP